MKELLLQHGFKFDGTCKCNGVHNEKYRMGIHQFKIQPGFNTWKYLVHGKQRATGNNTNLIDKLNELAQLV